MKKTLITILLLFSVIVKAQQVDVLYIPTQKSLVGSYNYKQIGLYVGGYYVTTFPQPYIYTTPLSIINRVGLTYVNKENTFSVMGGAYLESYFDHVEMTPDIWIKIYPIRMCTKDKTDYDFALGLNYMDGFRIGVGLSIPYQSIYR
jgi:hypothetical protein